MKAINTLSLKYVLEQQHPSVGLVKSPAEVVFSECSRNLDNATLEEAAREAWANIKKSIEKSSAFKVCDPQLVRVTTYTGVKWD